SHLHFFIFFFQAEDGIRDFHVTGVQTCALPIYFPMLFNLFVVGMLILLNGVLAMSELAVVSARAARLKAMQRRGVRGAQTALDRSEERRVGKEGGARGSPGA